jgi:hypothetical protein
VPGAGVPEMVAVPAVGALNANPVGNVPVWVMVAAGYPVVVTV